MSDVIRSTIIFFRSHRGATLLLTLTLSLVFFTCLILHAITLVSNFEIDRYRGDLRLLYTVNYSPASQSVTEALTAGTYNLDVLVKYLNISGMLSVADAKKNSYSLCGIDTTCTIPVDVYRGTSPKEAGGIMANAYYVNSLENPSETSLPKQSPDVYEISLANGETMTISCIGSLRTFIPTADFVVMREDFFTVTDSSSSMQVVFTRPLTADEEEKWLRNLSDLVSITGVSRPQDDYVLAASQSEASLNLMLTRILILVFLLCSLRLMTYLFLLRKQELTILRMLGADAGKIIAYVVSMLVAVGSAAVIGGSFLYFLITLNPVTAKILYPLTTLQIASDIGYFLVALILSGLTMYFFNHSIDVTRATEEV